MRTDTPADVGDVLLDEQRAIQWRRELLNHLERDGPRPAAKHKPRPPSPEISPKWKIDQFRQCAHKIGDVSALCLSGGGIRSAAFALGVVQGLAARGLLGRFDYLSTVSGGGYLGSFLTAWRHRRGSREILDELVHGRPPDAKLSPLEHLRRYSNYLTPRAGWLSADTLMVVGLYIRNLLLNWVVLLPIVMIAIAAVKFLTVGAVSIPSSPLVIAGLTLATIVGIGWATADSLQQRPGWADEESSRGRFLAMQVAPLVVAGVSASVAALKSVEGQTAADGIPVLFVTFVAGSIFFLAATAVLAFTPQPSPSAPRSTLETIRTLTRLKATGVFIAFVGSGALAGFLLAKLIVVLHDYSPKDVAGQPTLMPFTLICLGPPLLVLAISTAELCYIALTSYVPWGDVEREWLARALGYHLRTAISWTIVLVVVFGGSYVIWDLSSHSKDWGWVNLYTVATTGGVAGVITAFTAKGSSTAATIKKGYKTIKDHSTNIVLGIGMPVFVVILVSFLSAGLDLAIVRTGSMWFADPAPALWGLGFWLVGLVALTVVGSLAINPNKFSLHGVYRNRLIRTFLGASNAGRNANAFIDMDETDNLALNSIWPNAAAPPPPLGQPPPPLHVINMALNVLATRELSWQERKAISFTATPCWIGAADLSDPERDACFDSAQPTGCYRSADRYGGPMSLGTAMTISGAAASPNMGYHSSAALSVLLTFFNVRLGAWLGNPGPAGAKTYTYQGPAWAGLPLVQEAFGLTTPDKAHVYLSDGGHFENLGLYEMIRRRCHFIVVSDAGCDPKAAFEDLGNAFRRISIDLNVTIRFKGLKIGPRKEPPVLGPYCAIAEIIYPEAPDQKGRLLYIKPGFQGVEPPAVRSYAAQNPVFPHETTVDQWYGETQFEAYRALGFHIVSTIDGGQSQTYPNIGSFIDSVEIALWRS